MSGQERRRDSLKRRREKALEERRCVVCRKPHSRGTVRCYECYRKNYEQQKARSESLKEKKL